MSKIKIYRYSDTGFEACMQHHLVRYSKINLESMISNLDNEYLKDLVRKGFTEPDTEFEYEGIFIFLTAPSHQDRDYFLNHLEKDAHTIPLHVAEIDVGAIGYHDDGKVYDSKNKMTVKAAIEKNVQTFYIPKSQIHLITKLENRIKHKIN
jgi:disulfide oxidoreductase YuzD